MYKKLIVSTLLFSVLCLSNAIFGMINPYTIDTGNQSTTQFGIFNTKTNIINFYAKTGEITRLKYCLTSAEKRITDTNATAWDIVYIQNGPLK